MTDLRTRLTDRLAVLHRETEIGEERLRALEDEVAVLRRTLLRIDGAAQVLREILDEAPEPLAEPAPAGATAG